MLTIVLWSSFGAAVEELLHWYELRGRLEQKRYSALLRSRSYWTITGLVIVFAGIVSVAWFDGSTNQPSLRDLVLFGAAFPAIIKKAVAAQRSNGSRQLGVDTLDRYLGL